MGFEPRIIPAIYVTPFNKGQKNDYNDAEAIAEASLRPNLRTVSEKSQDQLDLQALHRVRSRLVSRRTATVTQIRAVLIEQGITIRKPARRAQLAPDTPRRAAGRDLAADAAHPPRSARRLDAA
jgi:transposase